MQDATYMKSIGCTKVVTVMWNPDPATGLTRHHLRLRDDNHESMTDDLATTAVEQIETWLSEGHHVLVGGRFLAHRPQFLSRALRTRFRPTAKSSCTASCLWVSRLAMLQVHCASGISRSATIVIWYLIAKQRMPLLAAYQHVKAFRDIIAPGTTFMLDLQRAETTSTTLVRSDGRNSTWSRDANQHFDGNAMAMLSFW
jgi:hypothetical protein